jgi:hypothetical protein
MTGEFLFNVYLGGHPNSPVHFSTLFSLKFSSSHHLATKENLSAQPSLDRLSSSMESKGSWTNGVESAVGFQGSRILWISVWPKEENGGL